MIGKHATGTVCVMKAFAPKVSEANLLAPVVYDPVAMATAMVLIAKRLLIAQLQYSNMVWLSIAIHSIG